MFYLEIKDGKGNWSNEIGDYNHFETLAECKEIIPMLELEMMRIMDVELFVFDWRILTDSGYVEEIIENTAVRI